MTSSSSVVEEELRKAGFNIVIHADHLLRSAIKTMQEVCLSILTEGSSKEVAARCAPVSEIFDLVGFTDVKNRERRAKDDPSNELILG